MTQVEDTTDRAVRQKRRIARVLVLVWALSSPVLIGVFHLLLMFGWGMGDSPGPSEIVQIWWWFGVLPILLAWVTAAISWRRERIGGVLLVLEGLLVPGVILLAMVAMGVGVLGLVPLFTGLSGVVAGILLLQTSQKARTSGSRQDR